MHNLSPRGERPLRSILWVLAADSSIKTSLKGSKNPCLRISALETMMIASRFCPLAQSVFLSTRDKTDTASGWEKPILKLKDTAR
jgi:hypothetical protein